MKSISLNSEQAKKAKISDWFFTYGKRIRAYIQSKISDFEEAEDISQEVWYQLSLQEEIDDIEEISHWLFRVAGNRIINFYKKKKSIPFSKLIQTESDYSAYEDLEKNLGEYFDTWAEENLPLDILESKEFWILLQKILLKLPEEQRQVFIDHELNDISFKEMSLKTGISINTYLARKSYAMKKIRGEFQKLFRD